MHRDTVGVPGFAALALSASSLVQAGDPAFDCRQAPAEVEKLICGNRELASRDRRLDAVYRSALAKAKAPLAGRLRTSELEAVWRLVPPRTRAYRCQRNPANEIVAGFFDTDPPTVRLERSDQTRTLWRVAAEGAHRYEGQNVSAVLQGRRLTLSGLDTRSGKTDEWPCETP